MPFSMSQARRGRAGDNVPVTLAAPSAATEPASKAEQAPATAADGTGETAAGTHDDLLAEIADEVGGFGGAVVDGDSLRIALVNPSRGKAEQAADALKRRFGRSYEADRVVVVEAQYNARQLRDWHRAAVPALNVEGAVLTDLDESRNRVRVGVTSVGERRPEIEAELIRAGVPLDAVIIEEAAPVTQTLRERRRLLRGGLQIEFQSGFAGLDTRQCTLGFPAVRAGTTGFVTNSHCSRTQGEVDNGRYWQATRPFLNTDQIGAEVADPAYTAMSGCPSGRRCRYSDAAFVQTESGVTVARGTIPQVATASTTWNGSALFRISGEGSVSVGQVVRRWVGRPGAATARWPSVA